MKSFGKLLVVQTKLYLREPMAVFFTLLLAPLMVVLFGTIFGTTPRPELGGVRYLEVAVPSYTAVVIGITALTTLPITLATRRESGVLRRFAATPLRPVTYFITDLAAPFVMSMIGIVLLLVVGGVFYDVQPQGSLINVLLAVGLATLAMFALGYALGGLMPSSQVAAVVGNVIVIPIMFFSGAYIPLGALPEGVQSFARFIPVTHIVTLVTGLWADEAWSAHLTEVAVLSGVLVLGAMLVAVTFKWE